MHMLRIIAGGLILYGIVILAAKLLARLGVLLPFNVSHAFIGLWALAAIANFLIGHFRVGVPFFVELGASAAIFAVPAFTAFMLAHRI
jgi:hypothetical protein